MNVSGSHKPLDESKIQMFEDTVLRGVRFPKEYRAFMLKYNGGSPSPAIFKNQYLQLIFPIGKTGTNLEREIKTFAFVLPKNVIPIALEGSGDYFCLDLSTGRTLLFDHELDYPDGVVALDQLKVLANTFDEVIENLNSEAAVEARSELADGIARWGGENELQAYLNEGNDIEEVDADGLTLVQIAAIHGNIDITRACIDAGASLQGAIHYAAKFNKRKIIDILLENDVDINETNSDGKTPLACVRANPPLKKYLLEKGAMLK